MAIVTEVEKPVGTNGAMEPDGRSELFLDRWAAGRSFRVYFRGREYIGRVTQVREHGRWFVEPNTSFARRAAAVRHLERAAFKRLDRGDTFALVPGYSIGGAA